MSHPTTTTRGILNPRAGAKYFTIDRFLPSANLAAIVERYWIVRWDLHGARPFLHETLPHPCVNVVFGTHRPGVHGVGTRRFVAELQGRGWVVGAKFRPGGFFPIYQRDVAELAERELPIVEVFGADGAALEAQVHAVKGDASAIPFIEDLLRSRCGPLDSKVQFVASIVEIVRADPSIGRACELATRAGLSARGLERLFHRYVGISPKWVIRRFRVHEACERVAAGASPRWSALAHELGYSDQSHFIREFKAQVGLTPAQYSEACASVC